MRANSKAAFVGSAVGSMASITVSHRVSSDGAVR
jgi:hypothetical protein